MKKLIIFLLLFPYLVLGQGFNTPEIKYGHKKYPASTPDWVKLMYSENPDPGSVSKAYKAYYLNNPFVKNSHTQYYKRWLRSFARDDARFRNSTERNEELKSLDQSYIERSLLLKNNEGPNSTWEGIGPIDFDKEAASTSYAAGAGHIYTIEQSTYDDSTLYCGTATAGVWKTTDKGNHWHLTTSDLLINEVVSLEITPSNNDIVYFGGGKKLYKTTDGGNSWSQIGDAVFNAEDHYIPEIKIHPNNDQFIFVCSDKGLFRSVDGGNNFVELMDGDFQELEFHTMHPDTVYTVKQLNNETQFLKSTDGGNTFFQKISGWPVPTSTGEQKRTEIAVTPAAPNKVIALCTGVENGGSGLYGVYVSFDAGETWSRTCCGPQPGGVPSINNQNLMGWADDGTDDGGQYYYDLALEIDDYNPNKVYVAGVNLWVSNDGGNSFTCPSKWSHSYKANYVHADIHDIKCFDNNLWIACDGGAFYSNDLGATIDRKMLGVQGTDFWGFGAGFWDGEVLLGGTYHNGTLLKDNDVYLNGWISTGGGDNIRGFVNPGDDRKVYHDYGEFELPGNRNLPIQSLNFNLLPNASYTIGQSSNIAFHPHSHNTSYIGKEGDLWVSHDDGNYFDLVHNFGNTSITSIEVARTNPSQIYLATYSGWWDNKYVWASSDSGNTWTNITPPNSMLASNTRWVPYDITIDSEDPNIIWIARTSMYDGSPDIDGQQIFKSTNGGQTWTNYATSTLDGEYITNIVHQQGTDGGVYIGTRRGVYYRNNSMNDWALFNNNLPLNTTSVQLIPYYRKGQIRNGTNRSAYQCEFYENSNPLAQITRENLDDKNCPNDYIQFYDRSVMNESGSSWYWEFEGGTPATSTDKNPVVKYENHGVFDVILTVTDTFGTSTQTLDNFVVIENCNGVNVAENIHSKNLDIYPTLLKKGDVLNVINKQNEKLVYSLYNAKGKLMKHGEINDNIVKTDHLSSGSYFLSIQGQTYMLNKTIVIR